MAIKKITIEEFIELTDKYPVIDVRSPGEFAHAHIPAAYSMPLFTDEERKVVGTLYKQESREAAIKKGLEYFGSKMVKCVEEAEMIANEFAKKHKCTEGSKTLLVHCWRGGMRSAGVAWLLDLYGFKVYTLVGGYKAFRQWVLAQFAKEYFFKIIGGYTGSGKTEVLSHIQKQGALAIDLEGLASHKGSAFGAINMPPQPGQEMFENMLALELKEKSTDTALQPDNGQTKPIYLEDESQRIGLVNIPNGIWKQMRVQPILFLQIPFEERLQHITTGYGKCDNEKLINATIRIKKRLGGIETKMAVNHLLEDNITEAFRILLTYYDRMYKKGLEKRPDWQLLFSEIAFEKINAAAIAKQILLQETIQTNA